MNPHGPMKSMYRKGKDRKPNGLKGFGLSLILMYPIVCSLRNPAAKIQNKIWGGWRVCLPFVKWEKAYSEHRLISSRSTLAENTNGHWGPYDSLCLNSMCKACKSPDSVDPSWKNSGRHYWLSKGSAGVQRWTISDQDGELMLPLWLHGEDGPHLRREAD